MERDFHFDNDGVFFPEFEADDEFERWAAWNIIALLHERSQRGERLTAEAVRVQMAVHLASGRCDGIDKEKFGLPYLKGALLRELLWQEQLKMYPETYTLPDWLPILALVEEAMGT
jgi:hypothetical protein